MIARQHVLEAIDRVLEEEKGLVNDPADRGGITNFGITKTSLARYLGVPSVTDADIVNLTQPVARAIYEADYVYENRYHLISEPWTFKFTVDCGVHHGAGNTGRIIQRAMMPLVEVDGVIGPRTRTALRSIGDSPPMLAKFKIEAVYSRLDFMAAIVRDDPSQARFIRGWVKRAMGFLRG